MKAVIEMIGRVEGSCLCISDGESGGTRVAGPKAWGGGHVTKKWITTVENIEDALQDIRSYNTSKEDK